MLGAFFYRIYESLFFFSNPPPNYTYLVPARYAIKFVRPSFAVSVNTARSAAASAVSNFDRPPSAVSTDYSVISSVNFVPPSSAYPAYSAVSSASSASSRSAVCMTESQDGPRPPILGPRHNS